MNYINVGNRVYINANEIISFYPYEIAQKENMKQAIVLSEDPKSVVVCKNGKIFLLGMRYDTLKLKLTN